MWTRLRPSFPKNGVWQEGKEWLQWRNLADTALAKWVELTSPVEKSHWCHVYMYTFTSPLVLFRKTSDPSLMRKQTYPAEGHSPVPHHCFSEWSGWRKIRKVWKIVKLRETRESWQLNTVLFGSWNRKGC